MLFWWIMWAQVHRVSSTLQLFNWIKIMLDRIFPQLLSLPSSAVVTLLGFHCLSLFPECTGMTCLLSSSCCCNSPRAHPPLSAHPSCLPSSSSILSLTALPLISLSTQPTSFSQYLLSISLRGSDFLSIFPRTVSSGPFTSDVYTPHPALLLTWLWLPFTAGLSPSLLQSSSFCFFPVWHHPLKMCSRTQTALGWTLWGNAPRWFSLPCSDLDLPLDDLSCHPMCWVEALLVWGLCVTTLLRSVFHILCPINIMPRSSQSFTAI